MNEMTIHPQARDVVRAAVDEKYGDGTSQMVEDYDGGGISQDSLAERMNLTQPCISQRVRKARAYTRRLLRSAGIVADQVMPAISTATFVVKGGNPRSHTQRTLKGGL